MSAFTVELRRIARIDPHPNADRLDVARLEGLAWEFVVPKGGFQPGDAVLYFPIDSVLPSELADRLGVRTYLVGKEKTRVKTARLRGFPSQGLVVRPGQVRAEWTPEPGVDYAAELGVVKYEPPPIPCHAGDLVPLPVGVSVYDIEGADNFPHLVDVLLDLDVCVTEKLEGSNWSATRTRAGDLFVSQRNHSIRPTEGAEHDFWRVAREQGLLDLLARLSAERPGRDVTLRGEYLGPGVQKNLYRLPKNLIALFDVEVDGRALPFREFEAIVREAQAVAVPVLFVGRFREWLGPRTVREASNGASVFQGANGVAREGIVVKPLVEQAHEELGRLILKQRSPEYLAGSEF